MKDTQTEVTSMLLFIGESQGRTGDVAVNVPAHRSWLHCVFTPGVNCGRVSEVLTHAERKATLLKERSVGRREGRSPPFCRQAEIALLTFSRRGERFDEKGIKWY